MRLMPFGKLLELDRLRAVDALEPEILLGEGGHDPHERLRHPQSHGDAVELPRERDAGGDAERKASEEERGRGGGRHDAAA